jgi:hypothetical protein
MVISQLSFYIMPQKRTDQVSALHTMLGVASHKEWFFIEEAARAAHYVEVCHLGDDSLFAEQARLARIAAGYGGFDG